MRRQSLALFLLVILTMPAAAQRTPALPQPALQRLGPSAYRPGADVRDLAYSPDGRYLVSLGFHSLVLMDGATGEILRSWRPHAAARVVFTPDSKALVVADHAGVRQYDLAATEGRSLATSGGRVSVLAPDGKRIASYKDDPRRIAIWNLDTSKLDIVWPTSDEVWEMAWSRDGKTLITLGRTKATGPNDWLRVWDAVAGKERFAREDTKVGWSGLDIAPDASSFAVGRDDYVVFDLATGDEKHRLKGHKGYRGPVRFSPDGKTLATTGGGLLGLWDTKTGKNRHLLKAHPHAITRLAFTPDNARLATGDADGVIHVWDVAEGKALTDRNMPPRPVRRLAISPDNTTVAAFHDDYVLRFWDRKTGTIRAEIKEGLSVAGAFSFSADSRHLLVANGRVRLFDVATGKQVKQYGKEHADTGHLWSHACYGPGGRTVAAVGDGGVIHIWDAASGARAREIKNAFSASSIDMSPDGKSVAIGTANGDVILFDVASGKEAWRTRVETPVYFTSIRIRFFADGRHIAAEGGNIRFVTLDTATGKLAYAARGFEDLGDHFSVSGDGRMVASNDPYMAAKGIVRVYERVSGKTRLALEGHRGQVYSAVFSADDTELISGGSDISILVWDMTGNRFAAGELSDGQKKDLWRDLHGADAAKAFDAILRLARSGQAADVLRDRLTPVSAKMIEARVAGLADDLDEGRRAAEIELIEFGRAALPVLEASEKRRFPSAEAAKRIPAIVKTIEAGQAPPPSAARLSMLRGIEALERDAGPEARDFLRMLTTGLPDAEATREAADALRRLTSRR
ncbi:MAG: PQQ-binding-like beta-propeller repeat protein [Gemmataceae bacterium]